MGLVVVSAALACGSTPEENGADFDLAQIWPSERPICLNYKTTPATESERRHLKVGETVTRGVQLQNRGRNPLEITSATLQDASRDHFKLIGLSHTKDPALVQSLTLTTNQIAILSFEYRPQAAGWDTASLWVASNAQNFPNFELPIVAVASPSNADAQWEPTGDKPEAGFRLGIELCPPDADPYD